MKSFQRWLVCLLAAGVSFAQSSQPPATPDELQYLRFMMMNLASLDHHAEAVQKFDDALVKQFGLNQQEIARIRAAANELNALLNQLRQSSNAMVPGKSGLTLADKAAYAQLAEQREQKIEFLVNQILNSVRPETAARLRAPGHVISRKAHP